MSRLESGIQARGGAYRVRKKVAGQLIQRTFETYDAAARFVAQLEREATRIAQARRARTGEVDTARRGLTVMDVVDRWFAGRRPRLTPGVVRDYEDAIRVHISRIGNESAEEFARNPRLLREFYSACPPVRALRVHTILKQAFEEAVNHDELSRNPCAIERPRRMKAKERLVPSPAEVAKLVDAASQQDPLWGLFIYLIATLGIRRGEACALRWEDFDFERRTVHVRRAVCKARNETVIKTPKSGEARRLPVAHELLERCAPFRRADGFVFEGSTSGTGRAAIPPTSAGIQTSQATVSASSATPWAWTDTRSTACATTSPSSCWSRTSP